MAFIIVGTLAASAAPGVRRALRNRPFQIPFLTFVIGSLPSAIPAQMIPFCTSYVIRPLHHEQVLALTGACFHALRLKRAREMQAAQVAAETVRIHREGIASAEAVLERAA